MAGHGSRFTITGCEAMLTGMRLGHPSGSVGEKAPGQALSVLHSPSLLLQLTFVSSKHTYMPLCCTPQHGGGFAASHPTKGFR